MKSQSKSGEIKKGGQFNFVSGDSYGRKGRKVN